MKRHDFRKLVNTYFFEIEVRLAATFDTDEFSRETWRAVWYLAATKAYDEMCKIVHSIDEFKELTDFYHEARNMEDNVRRCDYCGKPMDKGYYLDGEYACSDECCLALYRGDRETMEEELSHAEEECSQVYYTEWENNCFYN